ncbi:MAG: hypothetical protein ACOYMN_25980, partial [Roseimicrobium sp.]
MKTTIHALLLALLWHASAHQLQAETGSATTGNVTVNTLLVSDSFSSRINLGSAATVNTAGGNTDATLEPGENTFGDLSGASVWYQWTAPATGWVTIHTAGSELDTVLGIFTGATLAGLSELGHNDESARGSDYSPSSTNPSRLVFEAQAGTTYQIAVHGWVDGDLGLPLEGTFELHIAPEPTPPFRVTALSLTPSTVNLTTGAQNVSVSVSVAFETPLPDGDGFDVRICRPDGANEGSFVSFTSFHRTAGNASSGTYTRTVTMPRYLTPGNWPVVVNYRTDTGTGYDSVTWSPPGNDLRQDDYLLPFASSLSVGNTGAVDTEPAALVSVSGFPATVDVSSGPVSFQVQVTVTDALAGFERGDVFGATVNNTYYSVGSFGAAQRTSGNAQSGTYSVPVTITPTSLPNGTNYVSIDLYDAAFNSQSFSDRPNGSGLPIPPAGTDLKFEVIGAIATYQVDYVTVGK